MKKELIEQTAKNEKTYWWYVGRNRIIAGQLNQIHNQMHAGQLKILNVGSGTGGTISVLESHGDVINVDVSNESIRYLRKHGYSAIIFDGEALPFSDEEFDLVVAFDVLEHIEDHSKALTEWRRVLKKGGTMFLTVPAHPWLWSEFDEENNHYRRYTRKSLIDVFGNNQIEKISYVFCLTSPLIIGFRIIQKATKSSSSNFVKLPFVINEFLIFLLKIESHILTKVNLPFGTSLMLYSKKK